MLELPKVMYDWVQNKEKKVIDHISPSMLGGCPRVHYYAIKHIAQTTPANPGALLNFQLGFMWEEVLRQALELNGVECEYQKEMYDEKLNVKGTLDFLIKTDFGYEVVDCKTESLLASKYRKGGDYLSDHHRYVIQLGTYALMLRRQGVEVKRMRILNIIKDNGMVQEYMVEYTPELQAEILERIKYLNECLDSNTLPRCTCEGWEVGYCNYGNPTTRQLNKTKKMVNTTCCGTIEQIKEWSKL
jgi:predicted RecB family nuclease